MKFERNPIHATFELTLRCNFGCKMCMLLQEKAKYPQLAEEELSAAQWEDLARQAAEAGTLNLLITGSEPLLRKDFCEIYRKIYQIGFIITLYTNASLVTDQVMQTLRECPPHKIGITLYGASPETYKKVCGQDCFHQVVEGIRRLSTLPSVLEFRTTLIRDNVHDLDAMERLARELGNAPLIHSSVVLKSVRGGCGKAERCRLSPEEAVDLNVERTLEKVRQQLPPDLREAVRLRVADKPKECKRKDPQYTLLGCSGGMDSYTLTYDGKLLSCQLLGAFSTDAVALGLMQAFQQHPLDIKLPPLPAKCETCPSASSCTACPATRMAESSDPSQIPEYLCEMTRRLDMRKEENL